ncbi:MAG: ethanolamine utilization protein [Burkholderiales bacterium]|nr:ethanolamine utilization protein [Burkholderiales bacterium]
MFGPVCAFIDLETTGLSARDDGITEIAVILHVDGTAPREWSTLVRPPAPIPPEIARLTGISNDMVRDAPSFAAIAGELHALLDGALLVAHNARFDYAFLKQAFARAGIGFFAPTLCTARLARELDPGIDAAGLDALAARFDLPVGGRHRALGDARLARDLARRLVRDVDAETVDAAVKRVLKRPSLPKHLPVDALARLPDGPGVYLFYGLNAHPLYIGKAKSLRERVGAHFSGDWGSERGTRLSEELRRIETIETAGELSALLLEAALVRERLPAHNVRLRRRAEAVALRLDDATRRLSFVALATLGEEPLAGLHGPFSSRRAARASLVAAAGDAALCLAVLGLEKRSAGAAPLTPCFAYQVGRCRGACCGREGAAEHWQRLRAALAPLAIPPWPHEGAITLVERDPRTQREARVRIADWCLVDDAGRRQAFDHDVLRIVRPYVEGRKRAGTVLLERSLTS